MLQRTAFTLYILILYSAFTFAQDNHQNLSVEDCYKSYFKLQQENIYTQLNKTNVLTNEDLWFSSYIYYNKNATPYVSTTMVFYNVYNDKGQMVDQKVFHAKDGFVHGQLKIDDKYTAGTYYLKTTTNWMRNFNIDNSDIKTFVVNSESIDNANTTPKLSVFPEGGALVNDTENTIVVKLDGQTKNYKHLKGIVTNNLGHIVSNFSLNKHGLGKFNTFVNNNDYLSVIILDNDKEIAAKSLTNIKPEGLNLTVKSTADKYFITIRTNTETLRKLKGKVYTLYCHRDGNIKSVDIPFEDNKLKYTARIQKSDLPSGITILSLFNDAKKPILERLIFNNLNLKTATVNTIKPTRYKDSTTFSLHTSTPISKAANFSISVLPKFTKSYHVSDNILSKLLVTPYISASTKGYLNTIDNRSLYNLDLLLITQANSKESWGNILYKPQYERFPFDTGFLIKGKLNKIPFKKPEYIQLVSPNNAISIKSKLSKDNYFEFSKLYLNKNTTINFVIRDKKDNTVKTYPYYNLYPKPIIDSLNVKRATLDDNFKTAKALDNIETFIIDEDAIKLKEVELKSIKNKPKAKNRPIGLRAINLVEIPDKENNLQLVIDFIAQNGFDVSYYGGKVSIISRRNNSFNGRSRPQVFLDNINISESLDLISGLRVNELEEIFISRSPVSALGINGSGGAISMFTKSGQGANKRKGYYSSSDINFGFNAQNTFKSPLYQSTSSDYFEEYGVLGWYPNLNPNDEGKIEFTIPNSYKGEVNLYINGMDTNGNLFHEVKTITLE